MACQASSRRWCSPSFVVSHSRGVDESARCSLFMCTQCQLVRSFPNLQPFSPGVVALFLLVLPLPGALSALSKLRHIPGGAACALKTLASRQFVLLCITRIPCEAFHSYRPSQATHTHTADCTISFHACPRGDPPKVVLKREAVTMRTYIRQSDPSPLHFCRLVRSASGSPCSSSKRSCAILGRPSSSCSTPL